GPVGRLHRPRPRAGLREVVHRGRVLRRTDALSAELGDAADAGLLGHQHALGRFEIDGRERDLLQTFAGDRIGPHDDVDVTVLQHFLALSRVDRLEPDRRVLLAEDVLGDLLGDVDVEALQLTGVRITEAPQVRALVDARDEVATLDDVVHCGPRSDRVVGTQTRARVAVRRRR